MRNGLQEMDDLKALATTIARSRDDAQRLCIPFASRLLDMCLIEVAMAWHGREKRYPDRPIDILNATLETKLRVATAERGAGRNETF